MRPALTHSRIPPQALSMRHNFFRQTKRPKTTQPETIPMNATPSTPAAPSPTSLAAASATDDDCQAAQTLRRLAAESPADLRKTVALGLAAWELKELRLQHGEWGVWLADHVPTLCRPDSATGKPKAVTRLLQHMELAKNVLACAGFPSLEEYFATIAELNEPNVCAGARYLLLPETQVPPAVRPLRRRLRTLLDGCLRPPTTEDAHLSEERRLIELQRELKRQTKWIAQQMNIESVALLPSGVIEQFCEAAEAAALLGRRVLETRKGFQP
jgi:hypothetical protein